MNSEPNWEPGDVVIDAERTFWTRCGRRDTWPWAYGANEAHHEDFYGEAVYIIPENGYKTVLTGHREEEAPVRPLTLLVRGGKPLIGRTDADV